MSALVDHKTRQEKMDCKLKYQSFDCGSWWCLFGISC